ncbi:uncharacterized protein LOC119077545 isoform X2 [Bradysia coprophila]|uniref:uncharacterized protein LOC119077545 isoform X2 n=1 Tax=Bradysia coprophila TaxID=38358 RepID=UPI00187DC22A|nr:uncharacterized protein LOC119077545 isoform X2 [Bradysia coprophila]
MSRTAELGLPIPRKLMAVKEEFNQILERRKLQNLDQYLEKSLNTIYSKMLAQKKTTPSQTHIRKPKVRPDDFQKWLLNISKPKKVFEPEIMERVKGKVDINRIIRLSQPRHQPCPDTDPNIIAESALKYVATDRILNLAQPRPEKQDDVVYEIPRIAFPTNHEYASIKSLGTEELARPRQQREKFRKVAVDVRCAYDPVSKGALQYTATVKIRKLAKAKADFSDGQDMTDVFKVKKKALKKPSKKQENVFTKMSTPIEWKVTPKFETS